MQYIEGCAITVAAGTRVVDTYVTRLRTRRARVDGTATLALRSENVQLAFNCGWGREGVTEQGIYRSATTSREHLINIFMSVFVYIFTFIQRTSSKSKSSVLTDCSELDSEIILSECRIVGALEGTRLELGVRLVTLQPYTYWYNTAVQNFKNYRCWSVERRKVP